MTKQEIIEGNKLIAKFMGAYLIDFTDRSGEKSKVWMSKDNLLTGNQSLKGNSINGLRFHSSWDWLMPVVEKIEKLGYDSVIEFVNYSQQCTFLDTNIGVFGINKINAVWLATVEFIKWYNQIK